MAGDYWTASFIVWTLMILHSANSSAPITPPSADFSYFAGETVVFRCFTTLEVSVEWRFLGPAERREKDMVRDGDVMNGWKTRGVSVEMEGTSEYKLVIPNVQTTDGGVYRCVEDAGLGESHRYNLTVSASNHTARRATFWTPIGRPVVLPCLTSLGVPVDWEFRRSAHPGSSPESVARDGQLLDSWVSKASIETVTAGDHSLLISNPLLSNTGMYTCIEEAGLGQRMEFLLNVTETAGTTARVPAGTDVAFICLIQNATRIRWSFNNTIFYNGYRVHQEHTRFGVYWNDLTRHSVLIVKSAFPSDAGIFTCSSVRLAAASQHFRLDVAGSMPYTQPVVVPELQETRAHSASFIIVCAVAAMLLFTVAILVVVLVVCLRKRHRTRTRRLKCVEVEASEMTQLSAFLPDVTASIDREHPRLRLSEEYKETEAGQQVRGVCVMDDRLYVVRDEHSEIDLYNKNSMEKVDQLTVTGEGSSKPCCMTCAAPKRTLFISYYMAMLIRKIGIEQSKADETKAAIGYVNEWKVDNEPDGVEVTSSPGVLVAFRTAKKLTEFNFDGEQLRSFPSHVDDPRCAIKIDGDKYVLCYGYYGSGKCGLCLISKHGKHVQRIGANTGHPLHLTVGSHKIIFAADFEENRIVMFDKKLRYVGEALLGNAGVKQVFRLCFDETSETLFVGEFSEPARVVSFTVADAR